MLPPAQPSAKQRAPAKAVWNTVSLWTKKIHLYIGLLNFTILIVFGIAGLSASFERAGGMAPTRTETRPFVPPPNLDDYHVAVAAFDSLHYAVLSPPAERQVRRDAANNVTFDTGSPTGIRTVTLLEKEGLLKVESRHRNLWAFLTVMHTVTVQNPSRRWAIRMWSWYTEFSIWSLMFMSVTGVYLWLASRPGHRWALILFALGIVTFTALFVLSR